MNQRGGEMDEKMLKAFLTFTLGFPCNKTLKLNRGRNVYSQPSFVLANGESSYYDLFISFSK